MTHKPMDLLDYVRELCSPHQHREHYQVRRGGTWYGQDHVTRVPALLVQLRWASPSGMGEDRGSSGYESRPAAPLDSLDTWARIDHDAARWVRQLGEDDGKPNGEALDTIDCVRKLAALARSLDPCRSRRPGCCDAHDLEADVRRWWTWARVQTGWDSPAWRPDNTCPLCGVHGSLRVKLADAIGFCAECHETWDNSTIALLADHIRVESQERAPKAAQVSCWCPLPRPVDQPGQGRWPGLCPSCGSRWCHRAPGLPTDVAV